MEKYICYLLFLFVLFQGCDNKIESETELKNISLDKTPLELTKYEYASIALNEPKEIEEPIINKLIKSFLDSQSENQTKKNNDIKINIKKKYFISNNSISKTKSVTTTDIPILKVEISNQEKEGLAYICSDERFPLLLAYLPYAKDTLMDECFGANLMLKQAENIILEQELIYNHVKDSLRVSTLNKVKKHFGDELVNIELVKENILINENNTKSSIVKDPYLNNNILSKIGPYISTQWGQSAPYNNKLGGSCPDWFGEPQNYNASAIIVTIAQILGFYEPNIYTSGITINWAYLKQKPTIVEPDYFNVGDPLDKRNMVSALIKLCSDKCKISYTCSGSSYYMNDIINFLKSYNIQVDSQRNFDFKEIKNSLENVKFAICHGKTSNNGGHSWLIDGYMDLYVGTSLSSFTTWVHANMGMGSYYDGYYLVNSNTGLTFDPGFAHFNKDIVMYNNVRK